MSNSFTKHPQDLGVNFVPPQDITDIRVPTAEELSLSVEARILSLPTEGTLRFLEVPQLALNNGSLAISAELQSNLRSQGNFTIVKTLAVSGSTAEVATEYFYVLCLVAIVGGDRDALLNDFSLQFAGSVENKENTRRYRSFWAIVSSFSPLTSAEVALLLDNGGQWQIDIGNLAGFSVGSGQFYPGDDWVLGEYQLLPTLEIEPLCRVRYYNNRADRGYTWVTGSQILSTFSGRLSKPPSTEEAIYRLMAGDYLSDALQDRAILNLISGAADPNISSQAGMTSFSPNNSLAIANDQRVSFCNEARTDRYSVQHLTVQQNPQGQLLVTATLNTNNPQGTVFSSDGTQHRVYFQNQEVTSKGVFTNLGSDRSLNWIGGENAKISLGDSLIVAPAINFPAGSGFNIPLRSLDRVYYNGTALDSQNILRGYDTDLTEYRSPYNGEDFWVVYSPERASLMYVYKKISVTTDSEGTLVVPPTELGVIAFIEGITGRIDAPMHFNLVPSQNYNVLVYYPPRTPETWQLEIDSPPYQGLGQSEIDILNGGEIATEPICFLHSQGGGNSVFHSEGALRYSPIAMYLPALTVQPNAYSMNAPIQLLHEGYAGPFTLLRHVLQVGKDLSLPLKGKKLQHTVTGVHEPFSLNIRLEDSYGKVLGGRFPAFNNSAAIYQAAIAFLVAKDNRLLLLVATYNGTSGEEIALDATRGGAIDLFNSWGV